MSQICGCAFSNSSSSRTENGCLRTWAISGAACCLRRRRVAEQPVEALRRLVLAHVEPDEPVLGAEQEGAEGLRDLGLAGAGRADEEEDAERPRRVGEPRLHERDPVDEALDRLRLPEHAAEEGAHAVEAQRRPRVEHVQRQPGGVAERRDHRLRRRSRSRRPARSGRGRARARAARSRARPLPADSGWRGRAPRRASRRRRRARSGPPSPARPRSLSSSDSGRQL